MKTIINKKEIYVAIPYECSFSVYYGGEVRVNRYSGEKQLGLFLVHPARSLFTFGRKIRSFVEINTGEKIIDIKYDNHLMPQGTLYDATSNKRKKLGDVHWEVNTSANVERILSLEELEKYKSIPKEEIIKRLDKVRKTALRVARQEFLNKYGENHFEIKDYIKDSDDDELLNIHTAIMKEYNSLLNQIDKLKFDNKNELLNKVELSMKQYIDRYKKITDNKELTNDSIEGLNKDTIEDIANIEIEIMNIRNKYSKLGNILEENETLKEKIEELRSLSLAKTI